MSANVRATKGPAYLAVIRDESGAVAAEWVFDDGVPLDGSAKQVVLTELLNGSDLGSGIVGPEGPQGPPGPQGEQGIQGIQGIQGPQGLQGATGATGPAGADGLQGPQGIQGPQGPKGDTGDPGPTGLQGPPGLDGATGPQGPPGADGLDGDQGIQGPQGPQGLQGIQGPPGPQGEQGIQGIPGADGADGAPGATGAQGPAGADGVDGVDGKSILNGRATPAAVTPEFSDDFSSGGTSNWVTVQNVVVSGGVARFDPANTAKRLGTSTTKFNQTRRYATMRCRVRFNALPSPGVTADCITIQNQTQLDNFDMFVNVSGRWQFDLLGSDLVDTGIDVVVGHWYTIEVIVDFGTTTYEAWVKIDGQEFRLLSPGRTASLVRSLIFGIATTNKTYDFDLDDVAIATTTAWPQYIDGAGGNEGDIYLDTLGAVVYGPKSTTWPATGTSIIGATGPEGPQGPQGPQGIQGVQGDQGIPGDTGPAGADGATGPQGPEGPQGIQGIQGIQGPAGTNGTNGTNGTTSFVLPYGKQGTLAVSTGTARIYNDTALTWTIDKARVYLGTAPTGASAIFQVKKDGTNLFSLTVAAGTNTQSSSPAVTVAPNSYLTVDITQIGSTVAGADAQLILTVTAA